MADNRTRWAGVPARATRTSAEEESQRLVLPDGRAIGFAVYGSPDGRPVVSCHGGLSCRIESRFAGPICREMGVRLIVSDRPGIGLSDFQPGRTIRDWPDDMARLADHLAIDRFAVLGWSAGGPYALAVAWALPDRVTAVGLAAAMAPLADQRAVAELGLLADRILFPLSRVAPRAAAGLLSLARFLPLPLIRRALLHGLRVAGDPDDELLASLSAAEATAFFFEALRPGGLGTAWDYRLLGADWGFPLDEIHTEVILWQGQADGFVPPEHARRLARRLPNARLVEVPGAGHFLLRRIMREILAALTGVRKSL